MRRTSRITSNGAPAGKASAKGASSEGKRSASRRKKDRDENVYAFDEGDDGETKKKDSDRRFKGVSVYEYELGDDFEDEEIEEDDAFEAEDYEKYGNIGGDGKRGKKADMGTGEEADDDRELDDLFGDDSSAGSSQDDEGLGAMDADEAKEAIANGMDPVRSRDRARTPSVCAISPEFLGFGRELGIDTEAEGARFSGCACQRC